MHSPTLLTCNNADHNEQRMQPQQIATTTHLPRRHRRRRPLLPTGPPRRGRMYEALLAADVGVPGKASRSLQTSSRAAHLPLLQQRILLLQRELRS